MPILYYSLRFRIFCCVALAALLSACVTGPTSKTYVCRNLSSGQYCVQPGDSLSRIAQRFQTDVSEIKKRNHLRGDLIFPGQVLVVASKISSSSSSTPIVAAKATPTSKIVITEVAKLPWPVQGKVSAEYGRHNKGIDITAPRGTLIHAVADGTVMYSGSGVKGYGKLLLIRHANDNSIVTAYAHNDNLLVPNQAKVKAGQIIASLGDSGRTDGEIALHFEVRVNGKAVNPRLYLK